MKKIVLGALALLFTSASIFANGHVTTVKKVKQATCTSCPKGQKCTKATCTDAASCCK